MSPQPPRQDHTHIVETFMKDKVPLPNGFQALDDVGTPKPRMPVEEKKNQKTSRVTPQFCGSSVLTLSAAHQACCNHKVLSGHHCDPVSGPSPDILRCRNRNTGRAALCHSPVASLQGSSLLFCHLSLAQDLQLCHISPPLLSQASLPYSCQLLRVLNLEQEGMSQKGSHSLF